MADEHGFGCGNGPPVQKGMRYRVWPAIAAEVVDGVAGVDIRGDWLILKIGGARIVDDEVASFDALRSLGQRVVERAADACLREPCARRSGVDGAQIFAHRRSRNLD